MTEISNSFLVVLGISVVFLGLVCIIILCKIMSAVCMLSKKETHKKSPVIVPDSTAPQPIQNRQEIVAAVSAALAEELGTDVSAIRILSFKKI